MKPCAIVVAVDQAMGIGRAGQLPWHLPEDLKHFKTITTTVTGLSRRNAVVMGRKTWESLPEKFRPLPDRLNVVLSRRAQLDLPQNVLKFQGLDQALEALDSDGTVESVFLIGGGELFKQSIGHLACRGLHITELKGKFQCDVFFPPIPEKFKPALTGPWQSAGPLTYRFIDYAV